MLQKVGKFKGMNSYARQCILKLPIYPNVNKQMGKKIKTKQSPSWLCLTEPRRDPGPHFEGLFSKGMKMCTPMSVVNN